MSLLQVRDLHIHIGDQHLVRGVDLSISAGECLALVGESGSGKSLTALSLMQLLPSNARLEHREWLFEGQDMRSVNEAGWRKLRARRIAMVFQNPMTALNPTMTIGRQIAEVISLHTHKSRRASMQRAIALLDRLGIVNAPRRAKQYPFELSGGMLQRAVIAMAVACGPSLLIADEPTTALDVTVQAEVLMLLRELCSDEGLGLLLITHDLGVVKDMAKQLAVMYAGRIVESGSCAQVLSDPAHPYTRALQAAMPNLSGEQQSLQGIAGTPPDLSRQIEGCAFAPRCPQAMNICPRRLPPAFSPVPGQHSECWLWESER